MLPRSLSLSLFVILSLSLSLSPFFPPSYTSILYCARLLFFSPHLVSRGNIPPQIYFSPSIAWIIQCQRPAAAVLHRCKTCVEMLPRHAPSRLSAHCPLITGKSKNSGGFNFRSHHISLIFLSSPCRCELGWNIKVAHAIYQRTMVGHHQPIDSSLLSEPLSETEQPALQVLEDMVFPYLTTTFVPSTPSPATSPLPPTRRLPAERMAKTAAFAAFAMRKAGRMRKTDTSLPPSLEASPESATRPNILCIGTMRLPVNAGNLVPASPEIPRMFEAPSPKTVLRRPSNATGASGFPSPPTVVAGSFVRNAAPADSPAAALSYPQPSNIANLLEPRAPRKRAVASARISQAAKAAAGRHHRSRLSISEPPDLVLEDGMDVERNLPPMGLPSMDAAFEAFTAAMSAAGGASHMAYPSTPVRQRSSTQRGSLPSPAWSMVSHMADPFQTPSRQCLDIGLSLHEAANTMGLSPVSSVRSSPWTTKMISSLGSGIDVLPFLPQQFWAQLANPSSPGDSSIPPICAHFAARPPATDCACHLVPLGSSSTALKFAMQPIEQGHGVSYTLNNHGGSLRLRVVDSRTPKPDTTAPTL